MSYFKSFMNIALQEAQEALNHGEVPVGCVIVNNNRIISQSCNQNRSLFDPTAHAEIMAIRQACQKLKTGRLFDCDVYITLEPCAMCATAISFARIKNLYYILPDKKFGAVENGVKIFQQANCNHKPIIYNNVGDVQQYKTLLQKFFQEKR